MRKYKSTNINPQYSLPQKTILFSISKSKYSPPKSELKQSISSRENKKIFLPIIHMHIPSYEIVSQAKAYKKQRSHSSRSIIDYSMKNILSKNKKYDSISTKVDFFNPQNQRRLDLKKRKIFMDMGILRDKRKQRIYRADNLVTPDLHKLLQKYIQKRQKSQQKDDSYFVVGKKNQLDASK